MPFIFPGSSEQFPAAVPVPLPESPTAAVRDKLAALSVDEPLPEVYAGDLIRLLTQSPYRLYLYWNHARDPFATLRKAVGEHVASHYRLALRLIDVESGEESFYEAPPARSYWFNVRPGRQYRAFVGFYAPERPFVRLLTSEIARTPRVSVSPLTDETPEFHISAARFAVVLNDAGYASDALEMTLEAADEASGEANLAAVTRALARNLTGTDAPFVADDALSEMRALLAGLAFGVPPESLLPLLSKPLAAWLKEMMTLDRRALDASHLLDILRSSLAIELEYDERFDAETADAVRRAARFVWGASEVQMQSPTRVPHIWMPSMNQGLVSRPAHWRTTQASRRSD
ncbi:MAG TPA: DUF4912 domain-containing protein [Pyrinomonadaceae bacterium]|jgi:hypothetical protein